MTKPSLHVEIEDILAGMTTCEISDLVNQRGRYRNLKGQVGTTARTTKEERVDARRVEQGAAAGPNARSHIWQGSRVYAPM